MKSAAVILISLTTLRATAQQPVILLDPAQGGSQAGPAIAEHVFEKEVTLNLAQRLASLLRARGFTVELTRDSDADVSNDSRAALANTTHPIACILLHATPNGAGVHLFTSALKQNTPNSSSGVPWDQAHAAFADRSRMLQNDLKAAFPNSKINATSGQTWMRPLDNMQCPAVAVEVAPRKQGGDGAGDATYQAQVASAIANTLLDWRGKMQAMAPPASVPATEQPRPAAKPSLTQDPGFTTESTAPARQQP